MKAPRGAFWCLVLSLLGLGICGYLMYIHLGLLRGELLGGVACGAGAFNCHVVTGGTWGTVFGLPLAVWGLVGYVAVLALSLLAQQSIDWAQRASSSAVGIICRRDE